MTSICLSFSPLLTYTDLKKEGRWGSSTKYIKLASKYDVIYFVSMDDKKYNIKVGNLFIHKRIYPIPLPKILKVLYYYVAAGLLIFKIGRECKVIRALGANNLHDAIGSRLSGAPLVVSFRYDKSLHSKLKSESTISKLESVVMYMINQFVLNSADLIIATTKTLRKRAIEMGCDSSKIIVIPTAIDERTFNAPNNGVKIKEKYGLYGKKTIIFVGRLHPQKNVENLIKAVASIKENATINLLLVGRGYLENHLRNICEEYGVTNLVTFVGQVPHELLPEYLAAADLFVLPSKVEGLPKVLIEAMCMSKPIVATRVMGIQDVVKDGETALLVEPDDIENLRNAILDVINDSDLSGALSSRARKTFLERYSLEAVTEKYRSLVENFVVPVY